MPFEKNEKYVHAPVVSQAHRNDCLNIFVMFKVKLQINGSYFIKLNHACCV